MARDESPAEPGLGGKAQRPLERYVQLLEALATYQDRATMADLVNVLGLPKSTVYRLLRGLEESQLVIPNSGKSSGYALAPRLLKLIALAEEASNIESYVGAHLQELSEATGLTSFITKLQGTVVKSVAMRTPNALSGIYVVPGKEMFAHATASAKAIIAFQSEDVVKQALKSPLVRLTKHTMTSVAKVREEYSQVRMNGYALCRSEDVEGFEAVAAPISMPDLGIMYSVGLTGPVGTVVGKPLDRLLIELRSSAKKLSAAIDSGRRLAGTSASA